MVLRKARGVAPKASPVILEPWLLRVRIPAGKSPGSFPCCPLCRHCMSSEQAGIQLNLCFHLAFQFALYGD